MRSDDKLAGTAEVGAVALDPVALRVLEEQGITVAGEISAKRIGLGQSNLTYSGLFEASKLAGFATRKEIAETYAAESGRELGGLTFWEVLGMWKIAIIAEGVRRRALDEPANEAEDGAPTIELIDAMVATASKRAGI